MEQSVHRPFLPARSAEMEVKPLQATPTYRYRISDSHGRGRSTSPMGNPAIPFPPALADLGKERVDGAERPSTLSLPARLRRDGGVKPLQATPTYRYRISDSHGRGRSTSPIINQPQPSRTRRLGQGKGRWSRASIDPFLARSAPPRWRGKTPPSHPDVSVSDIGFPWARS